MNVTSTEFVPQLDLTVRVGCRFVFHSSAPTPALVLLKPRQDTLQAIRSEAMNFPEDVPVTEFEDNHGNIVHRLILPPGESILGYDAMIAVPSLKEDAHWLDEPTPPHLLPPDVLRYTLPSRYCDTDKLLDFAWQHFGHLPQGLPRIRAICEWLHKNIEYRTLSGSPNLSASDIIERRFGVCRDFAHMGVALCRTFNLPARYVSGYVPDIAFIDPGTPGDFHAYFEVFMGGRWQIFDARFFHPRVGRIRIAAGYDAVNCAFSTFFGQATLNHFEVWSYQVDPKEVGLGDPIDLSKRLCGGLEIKYARVS